MFCFEKVAPSRHQLWAADRCSVIAADLAMVREETWSHSLVMLRGNKCDARAGTGTYLAKLVSSASEVPTNGMLVTANVPTTTSAIAIAIQAINQGRFTYSFLHSPKES